MLGARIVARRLGDSGDGPRVLVIGAIHGNERAGIAIVRRLSHDAQARQVRLWVIDDLDPDGTHADTAARDGVDLDRNFPGAGSRTAPGTTFYAGPRRCRSPRAGSRGA